MWSEAQKRSIVEAAFAPGANVSATARRAEVSTSLVYRWRKDLGLSPGPMFEALPAFVPAVVAAASGVGGSDLIVVEVAGGTRVSIPTGAPVALAAAVLRALR